MVKEDALRKKNALCDSVWRNPRGFEPHSPYFFLIVDKVLKAHSISIK